MIHQDDADEIMARYQAWERMRDWKPPHILTEEEIRLRGLLLVLGILGVFFVYGGFMCWWTAR